jgi:hypothetical protein
MAMACSDVAIISARYADVAMAFVLVDGDASRVAVLSGVPVAMARMAMAC